MANPLRRLVDESAHWAPVDWWILELRSFDDAPQVKTALAILAPRQAWSRSRPRFALVPTVLALLSIYTAVVPSIAAAMLVVWLLDDRSSQAMPLETVGVLYAVSAVVMISIEVDRFIRPRFVSARSLVRLARVHVVPNLVVVAIAVFGTAGGVHDAQWNTQLLWLLLVVVDTAVIVWSLKRGPAVPSGPQSPLDDLRLAVGRLDSDLAARIRAERDDAIVALREQSKIDGDTAAHGLSSSLGELAIAVAPAVASPYYSRFPGGQGPI